MSNFGEDQAKTTKTSSVSVGCVVIGAGPRADLTKTIRSTLNGKYTSVSIYCRGALDEYEEYMKNDEEGDRDGVSSPFADIKSQYPLHTLGAGGEKVIVDENRVQTWINKAIEYTMKVQNSAVSCLLCAGTFESANENCLVPFRLMLSELTTRKVDSIHVVCGSGQKEAISQRWTKNTTFYVGEENVVEVPELHSSSGLFEKHTAVSVAVNALLRMDPHGSVVVDWFGLLDSPLENSLYRLMPRLFTMDEVLVQAIDEKVMENTAGASEPLVDKKSSRGYTPFSDMSKILSWSNPFNHEHAEEPGLWLGSHHSLKFTGAVECKYILTLGNDMDDLVQDETKKRLIIRLPDDEEANISTEFEKALAFIEEARASGEHILVHCYAGVSRSATIVLAYLMKTFHIDVHTALAYVKGRRPVTWPNCGFVEQLLTYQHSMHFKSDARKIRQCACNSIYSDEDICCPWSDIQNATWGNNTAALETTVFNHKHDSAYLNSRNGNGYTALHIAAHLGHHESLHVLVKYGLDVTALDNKGNTAHYVGSQNNISPHALLELKCSVLIYKMEKGVLSRYTCKDPDIWTNEEESLRSKSDLRHLTWTKGSLEETCNFSANDTITRYVFVMLLHLKTDPPVVAWAECFATGDSKLACQAFGERSDDEFGHILFDRISGFWQMNSLEPDSSFESLSALYAEGDEVNDNHYRRYAKQYTHFTS